MTLVFVAKDLLLEKKQRTNEFQVYIYIYNIYLYIIHLDSTFPDQDF